MLEAGLEGLWTPVMIARIGYCRADLYALYSGLPDRCHRRLTLLPESR